MEQRRYARIAICVSGLYLCFALIAGRAVSTEVDSPQVNLDSLIINSLGGTKALAKIHSLTSIRTTGNVRLNNLEGKFTTITVLPNKYYNELIFPQFAVAQGYDGKTTWQRNYNGHFVTLTGYERNEILQELYFESFSFLTGNHVAPNVHYYDHVILDNIPYHQISFTPDSLDTVFVYFATETGKRCMTLSKLDNAVTMTYIDNHRSVNGILFPSVIRTLAPAAGLDVEAEVTNIKLNQKFPDSLFAPKFDAKPDYHFPADSSHITIPLIYKNGQIAIHAKVNGTKKVHFILDTGASTNIFGTRLTADATLPIVGSLPAKGVSGFSSINLVRIDSLEIGGVTLFEQVGGSLDLSQMIAVDDTAEYLGILGYDFFSRFPMLVDYKAQTLTIYNPTSFTPPIGGVLIPFDLTMLIPTVHAELNGISGRFLVDLGNSLGVIVHPYFARVNQLNQLITIDSSANRKIGGVGGSLQGEAAVVDSFKMGGVKYTDLNVLMTEESQGVTGSQEIAGNIGNEFLCSYTILIDYHLSHFILYPADPQ